MSLRTIRRALLSVSDKTGLVEFAKNLAGFGVELISTGGTRKALADAGLKVLDISELTGFPEMLDGRVKTLHPRVHGGILHIRDNAEHQTTIKEHKIVPIDMVVCNLYPFEATIARLLPSSPVLRGRGGGGEGAEPSAAQAPSPPAPHPLSTGEEGSGIHDEIIETIDIGGPSMVRSASKNYHDVAVVTEPSQYDAIAQELKANQGALSLPTRERLAGAAFARTAAYDAAIAGYFAKKLGDAQPERLTLGFQKKQKLRYGENPHQPAAFYAEANVKHACVAAAEVLHGKELSYNNLLDLDSAMAIVREFDQPAAVVIKHNNPCGCAISDSLSSAFEKAYAGDPVSAFGGIFGLNRVVDLATAEQFCIPDRFVEAIIAPGFTDEAFQLLTTKPKWKNNVRLLRVPGLSWSTFSTCSASDGSGHVENVPHVPSMDYRRVSGGLLVQTRDDVADPETEWKVVTNRQPTDAELRDLRFAWRLCKHVKSNAIVFAKDGAITGTGAGQMSRLDSSEIATKKSADRCQGGVVASDAFFPFRDGIDQAAKAGILAAIQPGGSRNDPEVIAAGNEHGMTMIFTGRRHFKH